MPREPLRVEIVDSKPRYELWLSICALFVSLFALGVSAWQTYQTQLLARLSAKPYVDFVYQLDLGHERPGLYLVNSGMGPAIIRELELYLDGSRVTTWEDLNNRVMAEKDHPWKTHEPYWVEIGPGTHMKTDERIGIFATLKDNVRDRVSFERLCWRRIGVWARYCSMHGECWEIKTPHAPSRIKSS